MLALHLLCQLAWSANKKQQCSKNSHPLSLPQSFLKIRFKSLVSEVKWHLKSLPLLRRKKKKRPKQTILIGSYARCLLALRVLSGDEESTSSRCVSNQLNQENERSSPTCSRQSVEAVEGSGTWYSILYNIKYVYVGF